MGLLDDAIREHLELKRRRGADPGLVAREEKAALGPPPARRADGVDQIDDLEPDEMGPAEHDEPAAELDRQPAERAPQHDDSFSSVGQETAELDMRSVLDHPDVVSTSGPPIDADEDSLEWEVPVDEPAGGAAPADEAAHMDHHDGDEDGVDDVLEETPEFLRDTPEEDRLWFEQRPPRDFDFDK